MDLIQRFIRIPNRMPNELVFNIFLMLPRNKIPENIMNDPYFCSMWSHIHIKEKIFCDSEVLISVHKHIFCHYTGDNCLNEILHMDEMIKVNNSIIVNGKQLIGGINIVNEMCSGYEIDYIIHNSLYKHTVETYEDGNVKFMTHIIYDDNSYTEIKIFDNYNRLNIIKKNILNNNIISEMNFIFFENKNSVEVRNTDFGIYELFHNVWLSDGEHKEYFMDGNLKFVINYKCGNVCSIANKNDLFKHIMIAT